MSRQSRQVQEWHRLIERNVQSEQENYSMFLVTCYMEGFIEIWKFKII